MPTSLDPCSSGPGCSGAAKARQGARNPDTRACPRKLEGRARHTRVLVAKSNALVHDITDGLDARPAGLRMTKQLPGEVEHAIAIAVAAA